MRHLNITVTGKVQGVFFRALTKQKADELQIAGTVTNEPDGSVFIEAEGHDHRLKELVDWLHHGPPTAEVATVTCDEGRYRHLVDFIIIR